jgi:hypothetical protein
MGIRRSGQPLSRLTFDKKRPKRSLFVCLIKQVRTPFGTRSSAGLKLNVCFIIPSNRRIVIFCERSFTKRVFAIKLSGKPRSA